MAAEKRFDRVALVVNSGSRSGAATYEEARRRLGDLGVPLGECYPVADGTRLPEVVAEVADHHDLVVVGGGDGTLSTAVDHLAPRGTALGVLPLGTANDFARTLRIPFDLAGACETIAHGKVVDVDLGRIGDNYFVNVASIGLSVGVTQALTSRMKRRLGPLAYPLAAARAYRAHRPFRARLSFPDGDHAPMDLDDLLQVAVGNGRHYGGGNVVSPSAGIDDDTLDVYAIPRGSLRDHLSIARLLRSGHFVRHRNVVHVTTRRLNLHAEPEQAVNVDGEVVASTPQEFAVQRNALVVLVPQESDAARLDTHHR
ncbi:lipid kinase [Actinopolymorpha sp. NPDC004070]|uniref:lipid kinase n=1 Tax=Actinopolymorpha sp. NPDC004070 TaxID=3154548 RepID=UPI0033BC899F